MRPETWGGGAVKEAGVPQRTPHQPSNNRGARNAWPDTRHPSRSSSAPLRIGTSRKRSRRACEVARAGLVQLQRQQQQRKREWQKKTSRYRSPAGQDASQPLCGPTRSPNPEARLTTESDGAQAVRRGARTAEPCRASVSAQGGNTLVFVIFLFYFWFASSREARAQQRTTFGTHPSWRRLQGRGGRSAHARTERPRCACRSGSCWVGATAAASGLRGRPRADTARNEAVLSIASACHPPAGNTRVGRCGGVGKRGQSRGDTPVWQRGHVSEEDR